MNVTVAPGWRLIHLTDRVIELRKDCPIYRRMCGRDGYVRVRGEPGMSRDALMTKAIQLAEQTDVALGLRVAWRAATAVGVAWAETAPVTATWAEVDETPGVAWDDATAMMPSVRWKGRRES